MSQAIIRDDNHLERKIISVSMKRQITIPQKYFEALGFNNEAECVLGNGYLMIRPVQDRIGSEFSEQILADLIAQGLMGNELLEKFKQERKKVRPAVMRRIAETDALIKNDEGKIPLDELFGTEE